MMDDELLTYDQAVVILDNVTRELRGDMPQAMYIHGLEQTMAVIRDNIAAMGCDPRDKSQLRAVFAGAMMFMLLQAGATPINPQCVLLMDAMKTIEAADPIPADVWASLALRGEPRRGGVRRLLTALLRRL